MGKSNKKELLVFLKPFPPNVRKTAMWLRDFAWDLYPHANEIIYDNYNAVAFGWSITDRVSHLFCNIAVGRSSHRVHFGFYWGSKLSDPEKRLLGEGNQYRYLLVNDTTAFPTTYVKQLMKQAYTNALTQAQSSKGFRSGEKVLSGQTIVKSVSAVKRPAKKARQKPAPK